MGVRNWLDLVRRPSTRFSVGALIAIGIAVGVAAVPSFTFMVHETSTDAFCLVCHSQDIGLEMTGTVHYDGPSGVTAGCADCHLPKAFWPKVFAKADAGIRDVYHTALGTIDTIEKFEAHRMDMATRTWDKMRANDSRECRSCHDQSRWNLAGQSEKAQEFHAPALTNGKTCIDCHKGLAHKLPEGIEADPTL